MNNNIKGDAIIQTGHHSKASINKHFKEDSFWNKFILPIIIGIIVIIIAAIVTNFFGITKS